ncbi:MAG: lysine 2,3-aminomutase [Candidatus Gastranaerophilales bacterium]|nr:lysine 2,3-aminomutase [Candidatus Gastranaerophilales bacterium]
MLKDVIIRSKNSKIEKIVKKISPNENFEVWFDWRWQVKNTIKTVDDFEMVLGIEFAPYEKFELMKTAQQFPLSITPYYLSQIDINDYKNDPIFKQAFPSPEELNITSADMQDPLYEDADSPVKGITHRYPDRVLFHISNKCAMYCRHCTRKRKVGDVDFIPTKDEILEGIEYIKHTPAVRDVLLSGGDPFMLPDAFLDWILTELKQISHVEVVRIGTRVPVVLPYRVTDELIEVFKKHKPIWINTHFNHPKELTSDAKIALDKLSDAGIPLGNQSVLLAGVNDCVHIMKKLVRKLVQNRVRPYYLYQCDLSIGLSHFRTPVSKGIEIIEGLRGHTSGFAVPTFVIDAPGGGGKIPIMPSYMISCSTNKVILRNFEGIITSYQEPDKYEHKYCNLDCDNCVLSLKMDPQEEVDAVGINKLLFDSNEVISLIPNDMERIENRNND